MKKNIYVSDLDGTLLTTDSKLSEATRVGLNKLMERDVVVIFASARGSGSMINVLEGIEIKYPLIECNGAYITDAKTRKHIGINKIALDTAEKVIDIFNRFDNEPMISCHNNDKDNIYYSKLSNEAMTRFFEGKAKERDDRITQIGDLKMALKGEVVSFNFISRREELEVMHNIIEKECPEVSAVIVDDHEFEDWHWLMINSRHATKGTGIKGLLKTMGIENYHLTAFGDNLNDVPMFQVADYSVATGNASKVLKDIADEIIGHCDTDSVINYIIDKEFAKVKLKG